MQLEGQLVAYFKTNTQKKNSLSPFLDTACYVNWSCLPPPFPFPQEK